MRVFLTGGTGFIGSHTLRELAARGHEVCVLTRSARSREIVARIAPGAATIAGDLLGAREWVQELRRQPPDACIHLAWYVETGQYLRSPVQPAWLAATLGLAKELGEIGCRRLLATGTCIEYDVDAGWLPESTPLRPRSVYAAAKAAASTVLEHAAEFGAPPCAWLRLFYQYGPGEDPRRLVPGVVTALLDGRSVDVTPGEQVRDYLHVQDVARAIVAVLESDLIGPVNVGSGEPVRVRQVVDEIGAILGRRELIRFGARPLPAGEPMFICANVDRLKGATGWTPRYSLYEGLRETIDWWKSRLVAARRCSVR